MEMVNIVYCMHGHTVTVDYFDLLIEFVFYANKTYLF